MKSNKGFTLIELLAVIVILAIIALIATPIILNVIDTAKKGSAEASALAYIKAVEDQVVIGQVTTDSEKDDNIAYPDSDLSVAEVGEKVTVKGTKPDSGNMVLDSTGAITSACLVVKMDESSSYNVHYNGKKAEVKSDACGASSTPTEPEDGTEG